MKHEYEAKCLVEGKVIYKHVKAVDMQDAIWKVENLLMSKMYWNNDDPPQIIDLQEL